MHVVQKKILDLAGKYDLKSMKLREIGSLVGVHHPQLVKHHFDQLKKRGFLNYNGKIAQKSVDQNHAVFLSLPIYGSVNCGEATFIAEENLEGYLKVSPSLVSSSPKHLFALKAVGLSMNQAKVGGKYPINDGDYVVIDKSITNPKPGEYIVSIIDGVANIKKFLCDPETNQIILSSESTLDFPPIYINENDNYHVNGCVIAVFKNPKSL
jgi:repressor LexA